MRERLVAIWRAFWPWSTAEADGYGRVVPLYREPEGAIPIERHMADLDRYQGKWVAIHEGKVATFADSAALLAVRLRELKLMGIARAEYVPGPVAGYKVGLG